jgi:hypothetical protein
VKNPKIPPLVLQTPQGVPPRFWGDGGPIGPDPGVVDPAPMQQFLGGSATIKQGIAVTTPVQYGDQQIGPAGAVTPAAGLAQVGE